MSNDLKTEFWSRIAKVQAGMLQAENARPVPMSPYAEEKEGAIWFITADGTDVVKAAQGGSSASLQVADSSAHLYATVEGRIDLVQDRAKLDELWNSVASAWFEEGRDDPDIRLVRMQPERAEVWATDGAAGFFYEIAKANLTDDKPDMGEHGVITF